MVYTDPTGQEFQLEWETKGPGKYEALIPSGAFGLYRITAGGLEVVGAQGPAAPVEFAQTLSTAEKLLPMIDQTRGAVVRINDGLPRLRNVGEGRNAAGRGWVGITPRGASQTLSESVQPLLPPWAWLLLSAGLFVLAWLREGKG